jgi:predicted transcriptional regulator
MTPLQLIQTLREYVEKDLLNVDSIAKETNQSKSFLERKLKHLIEECDCWSNDETEYIVEN